MFTTFAEFIFYCFTGEIETITNMWATFLINAFVFCIIVSIVFNVYSVIKR